ncbi:MAG: IS200/IS605 family transposase [Synechococcales cyanobacterium RM1_1_8]|nr:IS200/IS605 family transposase [Synechococcales cyanobacterium RM1_1_8]
MAFWRTYYHLIWTTKEREPLIQPEVEALLYPYILGKVQHQGGIAHAANGVEDHVHLIVSIPPKLAIADFIQHIKGSSSRHIRQNTSVGQAFQWQRGYGVLSLGSKQLDIAIAYVENQKLHHAEKSTIPALEHELN